ncbi:MAG: hypothetical protein ACYDA3_04010 [Gaiellaceae bacterium]
MSPRTYKTERESTLPDGQEDEGAELVREVIERLESGHIPPAAAALEQYADRLR